MNGKSMERAGILILTIQNGIKTFFSKMFMIYHSNSIYL